MGRPNFQRLAELGQLPDYMKPTFNQAIAQVNAMNKKKKEVEEKQIKEDAVIEEVSTSTVEEELLSQSKSELRRICEQKGLDNSGSKEELIERILSPSKVEEVKEKEDEKPGEFVDSLLQ